MKVALAALMNPMRGMALQQQRQGAVGTALQNAAQSVRRDSVSISGDYRSASNTSAGGGFLKSLMDRKDYLQQARKELLSKTPGSDVEKQLLKDQVKELDKQLSAVNQQLTEYMLEKQKKAMGQDEEKKEDQPLTRDEAQKKQMETLTEAQMNLETMDDLRYTRAVLERSAAHQREWSQAKYGVGDGTPVASTDAERTLAKMETGIARLEQTEHSLLAKSQDLAEETAALGVESAGKAEETKAAEGEERPEPAGVEPENAPESGMLPDTGEEEKEEGR